MCFSKGTYLKISFLKHRSNRFYGSYNPKQDFKLNFIQTLLNQHNVMQIKLQNFKWNEILILWCDVYNESIFLWSKWAWDVYNIKFKMIYNFESLLISSRVTEVHGQSKSVHFLPPLVDCFVLLQLISLTFDQHNSRYYICDISFKVNVLNIKAAMYGTST